MNKDLHFSSPIYTEHNPQWLDKLLSQLQSERDSLDARLNQTKEDMEKSRTDMLQLNDVLRNMDLLDCNYVMMYNNSDDIGYLIDKEEHHLSVDDQGDISLTPMKEHRRSVRQQDQSNTDDDSLDAFDGIFDIERLSDPTAPRTEEEFNEGKLPDHHPNLRFGE